MKKLLLVCLSFTVLTTQAQIVNIPDVNFKAALISGGVDLNSDGQIQLSEAQSVTTLDVQSWSITDLTGIEAFTALNYLSCGLNQLTTLDVSNNTALIGLGCVDNHLSSLDVRSNTALTNLWCDSNQIASLDVSMNTSLTGLSCTYNCKLFEICVNHIQLELTNSNSTWWRKDPFATWITICADTYKAGNVYNDINNNGVKDMGEPPIERILIKQDTASFCFISNDSGVYWAYYKQGPYMLTIPNIPLYCSISPLSNAFISVTDSTNDFGLHFWDATDVSVYDASSNATPGLETYNYITYRNNGTLTATGKVRLVYDGELNYETSVPFHSYSLNDTVEWNYSDLLPGESRNILVTFLTNSSAAIGDTLYTTTTVYPLIGDSCNSDNVSINKKVVTAPIDPNDKQVSDTTLTPEDVMSEKTLTYTIRFQNTGTDTAFTVVVKDTLSSLLNIPFIETLAASHPYTFKILENGIAAWTFNNILLPDSGANQQASNGFIIYKIKPKNNLVLGSEVKNTAYIYFDYNTPVATNTTTTRVENKTGIYKPNYENNNLRIYPNPASNLITLRLPENTAEGEIKVYNCFGQLVFSKGLQNQLTLIDISGFERGLYIIEANTNKNIFRQKFIKQ